MTAPPQTARDVVTASDINRKHVWLIRALDNGQAEIAQADEAAVRAKKRHRKAYVAAKVKVREALRATGDGKFTVGEVEDAASLATEDELFDLEMAEQALREAKERQKTLHSQVHSVQSMGTNLRSEQQLGQVGP